jgi:eukaryotic-like serine/threonine-protein kinase
MESGRLARYRILGRLGAGGMGEVYRARDEQLDRDVAVKVLPATSFDDPTARARLVREAKAAAALNHPNICTVFEVGEADGRTYIAMELIEGQTLSAMLLAGPLPADRVVHLGRQLAEALTHAHDRGVVHRDLKSNNVIVTPEGRVKVLDFGLAKRAADMDLTAAITEMHASLTQAGTAVGTLPYMSPEQLRGGPVQISSDIWALGVVLYEMAAGTRPFTGQTPFELSAAILNDDPALLPPATPPALQSIIERCLVKDPTARVASAAQVHADLGSEQTATAATAVRTKPVPGPSDTAQPLLTISRRSTLWIGAIVIALAAAGLAGWRWLSSAGVERSLAVLPLANASNDKDLEYLSDGIADSLIQHLSKLRALRVRPIGAVLDFKNSKLDPPSIGRRLGVETVLAGTLEQHDDKMRITARLVDVASGRQLWTNTYDRPLADVLNVQDEIASGLMNEGLRLRLTSAERQQLVRRPTSDRDAYDLFLQSRYSQRLATEEDYLDSRGLLEKATQRDPKFALAYASLAANYAMMVTDGLERPTDAWPKINRYMRRALELESDLPEALVVEHAIAFLFDWDWAGAARARMRFMESIIDIDPQYLRAMAVERWALGRIDEALALARRTRELDPGSPYLASLEADYLLRSDQFDAAVALYEYAIRTDAQYTNAYFGLAEAKARQGRFDEAIQARHQAHTVIGDDRLDAVFANARGEEGYRRVDQAWVRLQLEELKDRERTKYVSPLDFARAYAQLGDKEQTFKYLDAAFADRSPGLVFLKVDRAWDLVRSDPRFAAAIRQVGLP